MEDVKPVTGIMAEIHPAWVGRSIAGPRLRLVEFSAFLEQQLQPDTDSVSHRCLIIALAYFFYLSSAFCTCDLYHMRIFLVCLL